MASYSRLSVLLSLAAPLACGARAKVVVARDCPEPAAAAAEAAEEAPAAAPEPFREQAIAPTERHRFSVLDLLALDRISDPQVSPDGRKVAFVVRKTDLEGNRGRTDLWVAGLDGSGPVQLTTDPDSESSPRWAPDSETLYFTARHAGTQQIWRVSMGAAPVRISDFPLDVGATLLSPDGRTMLVSAEVFPDCEGASEGPMACTAARLKAIEAASHGTGVRYDRLFVRHWDTWADGRRAQLFAWPVAGGAATLVSRGIDGDVPSKPFGGPEEWAFTPDGRGVVFTARIAGKTEAWSTNFALFYAPLDGSAAPRDLTAGNPAWDARPAFSPDGRTLAYLAMRRPGYEADQFQLVLQPWLEGPARTLSAGWDRSIEEFLFSRDGATIYATADDLGRTSLFALDVASGQARPVLAGGAIHALARAGERVLFLRNDLTAPDEIFTASATGELATVTRWNAAKLERIELGTAEQFRFKGHKDEDVYGWVVRPPGLAAGAKVPVAFLIHGGPQGSFGDRWSFRWHPQVYAGAGYAAVMIDFHGSTGYGQAFTDAIQADWGGGPLVDLQKGLAAALARYPELDGSRVCALGASYGGFMVNWIAGQWQAPFRCLVSHDGVFDHRMMYYATEELWFAEREQGGPYWEKVAQHERFNPVNHVDRWSVPMLVIHGGLDYRISDTQGIAAFTALQRRGIPSRFLHFPDENHWVLRPANSKQWHAEVLAWLDLWLGSGGAGAAK